MKHTRNTLQRSMILDAVLALKNHPTANEIYQKVLEDFPGISRSTVYSNLKILADNGEIFQVRLPGAPDRFDFQLKKHYHIICQVCGKVEDIHMSYFSDWNQEISKFSNFKIKDHTIIFCGICPDCESKVAKKSIFEEYQTT